MKPWPRPITSGKIRSRGTPGFAPARVVIEMTFGDEAVAECVQGIEDPECVAEIAVVHARNMSRREVTKLMPRPATEPMATPIQGCARARSHQVIAIANAP